MSRHTCNLVEDLALFQPALFEFSLLRLKGPLIQMLLSCDPFLWICPDLRQLWQKNWKQTSFFQNFRRKICEITADQTFQAKYSKLVLSKPNSERNVGGVLDKIHYLT